MCIQVTEGGKGASKVTYLCSETKSVLGNELEGLSV